MKEELIKEAINAIYNSLSNINGYVYEKYVITTNLKNIQTYLGISEFDTSTEEM